MWKVPMLALALVGILVDTKTSFGLELKNIRSSYGPLGAVRTDAKFLPGDSLYLTYDIDDLAVDPKNGKAVYESKMQVFDSKKAEIYGKKNPRQVVFLHLGGKRVPGDLNIFMGANHEPGKYLVKLTVTDLVAKVTKEFAYEFELLKTGFGAISVRAPAFGMPGQHYAASFFLVNLPLDKTTKKPRADITMQVLDEADKAMAKPIVTTLPDALEDLDLTKDNLVPVQFPIYLNRPGRFTIDIEVTEKLEKHKLKLRLPLNVLELK